MGGGGEAPKQTWWGWITGADTPAAAADADADGGTSLSVEQRETLAALLASGAVAEAEVGSHHLMNHDPFLAAVRKCARCSLIAMASANYLSLIAMASANY